MIRIASLVCFLMMGFLCVCAQVPTITSFSPQTGPIGAAVTIFGTNFSITPANNVVYFGATRATVTNATSTDLAVTVPTGTTYQSITVTVNGLTAYSAIPFLVTFLNSGLIHPGSLATKVDFGAGTNPYGTAISDLDGDGKPELAVTNSNSSTVSIFRNVSTAGTITSGSFAPKVDLTTGSGPTIVAAGDLDGDGKPDLAVSNVGSTTVSVFKNSSTPGSINFAAKVDFTTAGVSVGVAIRDLDGDAKPDLVVACETGAAVSVFRNTSVIGTIDATSFATKVDLTVGFGTLSVAISDLDGDGKPDIAVANSGSNSVSVLRNTSTPGTITTGSFAAKVDFTTGTFPHSIAIGDLDADGKPDLSVANAQSTTVSVLKNSSIPGAITTGSFATRVDFTTGGANSRSVAISDLSGDGKPDLVITNQNTSNVSVFKNTTTPGVINLGSFASKVDFATGTSPYGVVVGDIDGDGKLDLAVANSLGNVSVLRNTVSPPIPTITSFNPVNGPIGTVVTITGTNYDTTPTNNIVYFGATQAIVATATQNELTVTVPVGATYKPITIAVNGLTAYSNRPFTITSASPSTIDQNSFTPKVDFTVPSTPFHVWISDLDGDSKPDIVAGVTGASRISALRNTSVMGDITPASFATSVNFITGSTPAGHAVADLDGDGKQDLAIANEASNTISIFKNTSSVGSITAGSFSAKVDFTTGTSPTRVAIGDLDGDGKPELVVGNNTSNSVSIFRNTHVSGAFTAISFSPKVDFTTGNSPMGIILGDLDSDGMLDLAVANGGGNTVSVFRNTSTIGSITTSSLAARVDFATGSGPLGLALGDLDGDGRQDLAVTNNSSNTVSIFRNTSIAGTINAGSFSGSVDFATGTSPRFVAIDDLNRDGKPDLAIANYTSNSVSILMNTSSPGLISVGSFAAKVDFATGLAPYSIAIGDLDLDGKSDLACTNSSAVTISVLRGLAIPTISSFSPTSGSVGTTINIAGTNFDSTPANNIVYFGATKATVTNANTSQLEVTVPAGSTHRPITVTVNGLVGSSSNPFIATFPGNQVINSSSFSTPLTFPSGSIPIGIAAGDFDQDGNTDIVVSNSDVDAISVLMNSSTLGSISFAAASNFPTQDAPEGVVVADLDGDGKLDIVVSNALSNSVSVFRNTSSTGSISFAAQLNFPTNNYPINLAIGDIDYDGKPDIVVPNYSNNNLSILRNTSAIGSISFAPKVDFATGVLPYSVDIADIDNDGKIDIANTNDTDGTVSVFRNLSTPGLISLATRSIINAAAISVYGLTIIDSDGDGKADLNVTHIDSDFFSVIRNTSTTGLISFEPPDVYVTGDKPYGIAVGDMDGDAKADYATGNVIGLSVSIFKNTSTPGVINSSSLSSKVDFPVGFNVVRPALADLDTDGRPDIISASYSGNVISVFRNVVPIVEPTAQPTSLMFSNVQLTSMTLNWTAAAGSPSGYIVLRKTGSSSTEEPADGTPYSVGNTINASTSVAYIGNSLTFNETSLSTSTEYYYDIFSFNGIGSSTNYLTTSALEENQFTLAPEPTTHAATFTATSAGTAQINLTFSAGSTITNAAGYIILRRQDGTNPTSSGITDGAGTPATPTAGTTLVTTITSTAATTYNDASVSSGIQYNYAIIPYGYNGTNAQTYNFRTAATIPTANAFTLSLEPTTHAATFTATSAGTAQINLTFSAGSTITNAAGYIILRRQDGTNPTSSGITDGAGTPATPTAGTTLVTTITSTAATTYNDASVSSGIQYNYAIIPYGYNGTNAQTYNFRTAATIPTANAFTLSLEPTTHAATFTATSAGTAQINLTFSAASTITNASGYIILRRQDGTNPSGTGIVDGATVPATPTAGTTLVNTITSTAATTYNDASVSSGIQYSYAIIPYGYNGTNAQTYNFRTAATIPTANAFTLSLEPTTHAATFTATSAGTAQINLTFSAASTITNAAGYIILRRQDGTNPSGTGIVDGATVPATPTAGTTLVNTITSTAATTYNDASVSSGIQYNYVIIPYGYNGTNAQTYNFRTAATIPAANAFTLSLEPTTHAATFTATSAGTAQINLTFSAASTITNASGYIILRRQDGTNPSGTGIVDGATAPATPTAGTTLVTTITSTAATTYNDASVSSGIQYNYAIIPYGYNGTNAQTYNFRTAATIPAANAFTLSAEPTAQSPGPITFSNITGDSFDGAFPHASPVPDGYLVLMSENMPDFVPVDGISYNINDIVGTVGGKNIYVVQNGSFPDFAIDNINPPVTLFFKVYSFNGSGPTINYLTIAPLTGSQAPLPAEPTIQATNLIITQPFASTLLLNWTNGNGASRLVVGKAGVSVTQAPVEGITYLASPSFSSGDDLGAGNYVVFNGSGNSVSLTDIQPSTNYQFFVFEYNGAAGLENYLISTATGNPGNFTVDTALPIVASNSTLTTIAPNTPLVVKANFTDAGSGVDYAELEYRPVAGVAPNDFIIVDMVPTTGSAFEYTIPANEVTELGIEYKFLVTDFANNDNSANQTLYRTRVRHEVGLPISYASPGRAVANYQIIAVPLELDGKEMNSVLGDELGDYDPTKWIMYRYDGTRFAELNGSTQLEIGKGYWLLTPNTAALNSGPGTTADVSESNPFQVTLAPGWNQIGNPYNFDISWADVLAANPTEAPSLGNNSKIRVFRGMVSDVDELRKFEGGFVRNTSTSSLSIGIPVAKNVSINGRKGDTEIIKNAIDQPSWEIIFNLKQGDTEYKLGGLGMHPEAAVGFDYFDDYNLPRFIEYLEVKFPKQRVGMTYTKDIVPTAENFVWEFTVESNLNNELITIGWDNSYFGPSKEIYLLDVKEHRMVNMRQELNYTFSRSSSTPFKVIFGDEAFVKRELLPNRIVLRDPYPNPFTEQVSIDYVLPKEAVTSPGAIEIHNAQGAHVSSVGTPRESGEGHWIWEGGENPSGMYFVRIRLGDQVVTKKILKQ